MANGNDKKKSLLEYFGMKSRDGDEALAAAQDSLRMDYNRGQNAKNIEAVIVDYLLREQEQMGKRNRADMVLAGRKDERYKNPGVFTMNQGFTEANPDTLRQRFGREQGDFDMIANQLLGRSRPNALEGMDFLKVLDNLDEPTRQIIQMLLDDYQGKEKFQGLKLN